MGKVTSDMSKSLPELRAILKGRVMAPDDADYDEARTVFYGGIDRRPADASEVSLVVALIDLGLEVQILSKEGSERTSI